ncbi:MAG TPA: GDSL-type esterase/lipase family protein [Vicinamibacterales bacterium]|nr:GDSL-type esterase/lipase family protein [Vicinamibacterales bacterium]
MTRSLARGTAAATALIVAALCAEIVVRVAAPQPVLLFAPGLYVADPEIGYRHAAGYRGFLTNGVEYYTAVRTNEFGLRGPSVSIESDTARIIVLGDSFVFGQGVSEEESLPSRLEADLSHRGLRAQVLNAGVRGYGTDQEARWLRVMAPRLRPTLVILGVFLGNDLQDDATPVGQRLQDQVVPRRYWHSPVTGFLYAHSHLYRAVRALMMRMSGSERAGRLAYLRANYGIQRDPSLTYTATAMALDDLLSTVNATHARLFAVLIPDAVQVEKARRRAFIDMQRSSPDLRLDLENPNRVYASLLGQRGIPQLDLTEAMRVRSETLALYFPIDGHLNRDGQRFAAEETAAGIVGLLKPPPEHAGGVDRSP